MATVDELPEDLRPLGRRVPSEVRLNQSQAELEIRCAEAQSLIAQADSAEDETKARRLRRDAEKYLTAMSLGAFMAEQGRLLDAIGQAKRNQATYEASALTDEMRRLVRDNPQPLERIAGVLLETANAEIERKHAAANRPRWFRRKVRNAS